MGDEATIHSSLAIRKGNLNYGPSRPTAFTADVGGTLGPTPGALTVDNEGDDIAFAELTTPSLCRIANIDSTNRLEYGIWDPEGVKFYPLGEVLPGESYVLRLARNLFEEYGTGTGTTGADTNRLRVRAITGATCACIVEAFEL